MIERQKGHINSYNMYKGFGFIRREKGKDVFFFFDDFCSDSNVILGDTVEFEIEETPKGKRAKNIKLITP